MSDTRGLLAASRAAAFVFLVSHPNVHGPPRARRPRRILPRAHRACDGYHTLPSYAVTSSTLSKGTRYITVYARKSVCGIGKLGSDSLTAFGLPRPSPRPVSVLHSYRVGARIPRPG